MAKSMIVCVDDETFVLDSIQLQISRCVGQYSIEMCSSGSEALDLIRDELKQETSIPLIISDYLMPGMHGDEFLRRAHELTPRTNIVILTGQATLSGVINVINNANIFRYLTKPWQESDLVFTVSKAIENYEQQKEILTLGKKYELLYNDMRANYISSIYAFANAIDAKDKYTIGHSQRVSFLSVEIAKKLKFSQEKLEAIEHMGILHDIGKIGIPDNILLKADKLTEDEYETMKRHVRIGASILKDMPSLETVLPGVLYHHEAYNGRGYLGLGGDEIPIEARILCLADAYDAMTSDRPYRKAMTTEQAIMEIERNKGTQFDPLFADIAIDLLQDYNR